jgi:hypothetical protein
VLGSECVSQKAAMSTPRRDFILVMKTHSAGEAELDQFKTQNGNTEWRVETSATQLGLRLAGLSRNEQTLPKRWPNAIQFESAAT